jgi:gliding motility-associated-like protein
MVSAYYLTNEAYNYIDMKRTNILLLSISFTFSALTSSAQLKVESDGISIKGGTIFSAEGLLMVPTVDMSLTNTALTRKSQPVSWPQTNSILRLYEFSKPLSYQGKLGLNFSDGELNGNKPEALNLAFSTKPSIEYREYSLIQGSVVNFSERLVSHSFVNIPSISNITAVTPSGISGQYTSLKANNVITPNGDGVNDYWVVKNIDQYPNNELKIFDRTGRVVYETIGYNNTWNGTTFGRALAEDSYYYILYFDSGKKKMTGFISIVRKE